MPNTVGPIAEYRARLDRGEIKPDPAQALAAEKLQALYHALKDYEPGQRKDAASKWANRFGLARSPEVETPRGLYMHGDVGRGKSMVMDLFFDTLPNPRKRRVHFHAFMQEVQGKMHQWRQLVNSGQEKDGDPIPGIADDIADQAVVLCFDEFHVTDIADAMILGRLFEALFRRGVVVVATSNWRPDLLYSGGLQRDRFEPFIDLICEKLDILHLDSPTDWRRHSIFGRDTWFSPPAPPNAPNSLDALWVELTGGATPEQDYLTAKGRRIDVPAAARGVARFSFSDLCEQPLGPGDYLLIATHFHTLLIDDIPILSEADRNATKRFMTLIDALYEHKAKLAASAAAEPADLQQGDTYQFEFQRTVSRLIEMQGKAYQAAEHLT
ncbi:MAG: cell division protein ZapE [Alphaproteobacteria bacterium]